MKQIENIFITGVLGATLILFSGCGVNEEEIAYSYRVKLSSLHYVKDANVSVGSINAKYYYSGSYDFNVTVVGPRVAVGGTYVTDEHNESNTSLESTLCANYLPSLNTDASSFTLVAPALHSPYEYININPFTTLLVKTDILAEDLALRYPVAASIESSFDFDVTAARLGYEYSSEDNNITPEICDALQELQNL